MRRLFQSVLPVVLSVVLWAAPADATTTHVVERAEQTTFAEFVATRGCLRTELYVYGYHQNLLDGDHQSMQTNAMIAIYRRNTCTHTLIAAPFGTASGEDVFAFNRRLWNARVKATIPVQDGGVGRLSYVAV